MSDDMPRDIPDRADLSGDLGDPQPPRRRGLSSFPRRLRVLLLPAVPNVPGDTATDAYGPGVDGSDAVRRDIGIALLTVALVLADQGLAFLRPR